MEADIRVLCHSSIRIAGEKVIYFDPYKLEEDFCDADVIFVTHDHYDHFSPEDIEKLLKKDTIIVMPECMRGFEKQVSAGTAVFMAPGTAGEVCGMRVEAIPAYNPGKPFHPKEKGYVGYVVDMEGTRYYVAGDTDATKEAEAVHCDVALLPVGGKYTMDYREAARLVHAIKPGRAIPTHFGEVAGSPEDGRKFEELIR